MDSQEQQLFLMEFLVDRVNIPSVRAIYDELLPITTCVSFQVCDRFINNYRQPILVVIGINLQVLNLPSINISQDASSEGCMCVGGDVQTFRKGKSCLFALPSVVVEKPLRSFPVTMSVYKRLPAGVLPDVMLIGTNQIQAKDLFNALLNRHIFEGGNPSRTMKNTFKISTATGQSVGEVTAFIRVSCFGKKIVTQFQIPHNKKPYLFKGADNSPVYQCKKITSGAEVVPPPKCCCKKFISTEKAGHGEAMPRTCCISLPPCPRSGLVAQKSPDHGPQPCYCPSLGNPPSSCSPIRQHERNFPPSTYDSMASAARKCGCPVKEGAGYN